MKLVGYLVCLVFIMISLQREGLKFMGGGLCFSCK
jgi:hypothetical protein